MPGVERGPRQVLHRPGRAEPIADGLEAGEGLLEQLGGLGVLVAEQRAEPAQAEHLGLPAGIADPSEHLAGLVEGHLGGIPRRLLLLDVGQRQEGAGQVAGRVGSALARLLHGASRVGVGRAPGRGARPAPWPAR